MTDDLEFTTKESLFPSFSTYTKLVLAQWLLRESKERVAIDSSVDYQLRKAMKNVSKSMTTIKPWSRCGP